MAVRVRCYSSGTWQSWSRSWSQRWHNERTRTPCGWFKIFYRSSVCFQKDNRWCHWIAISYKFTRDIVLESITNWFQVPLQTGGHFLKDAFEQLTFLRLLAFRVDADYSSKQASQNQQGDYRSEDSYQYVLCVVTTWQLPSGKATNRDRRLTWRASDYRDKNISRPIFCCTVTSRA